jgi:hypothetical protein
MFKWLGDSFSHFLGYYGLYGFLSECTGDADERAEQESSKHGARQKQKTFEERHKMEADRIQSCDSET